MTALLTAKRLAKAYATSSGPFYALRPTTLSFPSKGLVAIKGKSGSGKSTLLNLLSGIETPTKGRTVFLGEPLNAKKRPLLGREGAMVFQHYNLILGESALYNVALPLLLRGQSTRKAKGILIRFGLGGVLRKKVDVLSGGEKQRVAICRALVTDPKIIFADEPTGALDEANSVVVMDALKQISKKRLVLLVSHNEELIGRYADRVVEIVDGRVTSDSAPTLTASTPAKRDMVRHGRAWVFRFLLRNIKKHAFKDVTCLLAGIIGFSSLLLSVGYLVGNMPAMEEQMTKSLTYLNASISTRTTMEVPGSSLVLVKKTRPTADEVQVSLPRLAHYDLVDDYGYFFPSSMVFSLGEETFEPTLFSPVYDITLNEYGAEMIQDSLPLHGEALDEAVVNLEFLRKFPRLGLGDVLAVNSRSVVTLEGKQNEVFVEAHLTIKAIVKEFGFLNSPRVYYSYPCLKRELENVDVFSSAGDRYSVAELVEGAAADSVYGNYGRLLFLHDPGSVSELFKAMEEKTDAGDMEIVSNVYSLRESFSSLSMAFTSSLGLFIGIALVGLVLILGMGSFSSLVQGKKENAILLSLGAKRGDILAIYCLEAMSLCLLSATISLILVPLLQRFTNFLLEREFDIPRLVRVPLDSFCHIPYGLVLFLLLGALLVGLFSSWVPLKAFGRISLSEELRDE